MKKSKTARLLTHFSGGSFRLILQESDGHSFKNIIHERLCRGKCEKRARIGGLLLHFSAGPCANPFTEVRAAAIIALILPKTLVFLNTAPVCGKTGHREDGGELMLTYSFENIDGDSMYEYLYRCVKEDILSGKLKAGEKLPLI